VAAAAAGAWQNMWLTAWPWLPCSLQRGGVVLRVATGNHGFFHQTWGFLQFFAPSNYKHILNQSWYKPTNNTQWP
jgi:hypothetical protein